MCGGIYQSKEHPTVKRNPNVSELIAKHENAVRDAAPIEIPDNKISITTNSLFKPMHENVVIAKLLKVVTPQEISKGNFLEDLEIYSFYDQGGVTKCECYSAQPRNVENIKDKFKDIIEPSKDISRERLDGSTTEQLLVYMRDLTNDAGGASYSNGAIFINETTEDISRTFNHEFGHLKQDKDLTTPIYNNLTKDFRETHNIIVNENMRPDLTPPSSLIEWYYTIKLNGEEKYYRCAYTSQPTGSLPQTRIDNFLEKNQSYKRMYDQMQTRISNIEGDLKSGNLQLVKIMEPYSLRDVHYEVNLTDDEKLKVVKQIGSLLTKFMNWGITQQIKAMES